jgi:nucleoid-associated protein YgaU
MDNELLDESRSPKASVSVTHGLSNIPSSRLPMPQAAGSSVPTANPPDANLVSKQKTQVGGYQPDTRIAQRDPGVTQFPVVRPHSTGRSFQESATTTLQNGRAGSQSGSDDPFGGDRPATRGVAGDMAGRSPTAGIPASDSRLAAGSEAVSAVGTSSDAADYYVVQPQDNFWSISRKKYGTSRYFHALAELNKARIPDPARMRPGMKVSTPPAEVLEERYGQFLPQGTKVQVTAAEDASAKSAPTGFFISADGSPRYRTGEKDTLSDIAARHLGRSSRWIQIFEMNRDKLASPNQVKVGTELALPGDASNVAVSSEDDDRR